LLHFANKKNVAEFSTEIEATNKIIQLFDDIGLTISKESLQSVPCAVSCGWRTPEECQSFVESQLKEKERKDTNK
jgi:hypothetical protein